LQPGASLWKPLYIPYARRGTARSTLTDPAPAAPAASRSLMDTVTCDSALGPHLAAPVAFPPPADSAAQHGVAEGWHGARALPRSAVLVREKQ
jgi:hypothetical protein